MNERFELKIISFLLVLLRVIMTAAFATDETKQIAEAVMLVRKSSSAPDEDAVDKKLSSEAGPAEKKPSNASSITENALNQLMAEKFGAEILISTDFKQLTDHLVVLVSQIVQKKHFTLEDKFMVENSMALWTGCILHQPELFNGFIAWKNTD